MNDSVLVDTSVWVEFFRYETVAGNQLAALLSASSVCTCGVVIFELLQGVRSDKEKAVVRNALSGLPYFEMNQQLWQNSAALSAGLKRNGLTLPLSDIFIAAIAIEHNLAIFTLDRHFEQIPGVRLWSA